MKKSLGFYDRNYNIKSYKFNSGLEFTQLEANGPSIFVELDTYHGGLSYTFDKDNSIDVAFLLNELEYYNTRFDMITVLQYIQFRYGLYPYEYSKAKIVSGLNTLEVILYLLIARMKKGSIASMLTSKNTNGTFVVLLKDHDHYEARKAAQSFKENNDIIGMAYTDKNKLCHNSEFIGDHFSKILVNFRRGISRGLVMAPASAFTALKANKLYKNLPNVIKELTSISASPESNDELINPEIVKVLLSTNIALNNKEYKDEINTSGNYSTFIERNNITGILKESKGNYDLQSVGDNKRRILKKNSHKNLVDKTNDPYFELNSTIGSKTVAPLHYLDTVGKVDYYERLTGTSFKMEENIYLNPKLPFLEYRNTIKDTAREVLVYQCNMYPLYIWEAYFKAAEISLALTIQEIQTIRRMIIGLSREEEYLTYYINNAYQLSIITKEQNSLEEMLFNSAQFLVNVALKASVRQGTTASVNPVRLIHHHVFKAKAVDIQKESGKRYFKDMPVHKKNAMSYYLGIKSAKLIIWDRIKITVSTTLPGVLNSLDSSAIALVANHHDFSENSLQLAELKEIDLMTNERSVSDSEYFSPGVNTAEDNNKVRISCTCILIPRDLTKKFSIYSSYAKKHKYQPKTPNFKKWVDSQVYETAKQVNVVSEDNITIEQLQLQVLDWKQEMFLTSPRFISETYILETSATKDTEYANIAFRAAEVKNAKESKTKYQQEKLELSSQIDKDTPAALILELKEKIKNCDTQVFQANLIIEANNRSNTAKVRSDEKIRIANMFMNSCKQSAIDIANTLAIKIDSSLGDRLCVENPAMVNSNLVQTLSSVAAGNWKHIKAECNALNGTKDELSEEQKAGKYNAMIKEFAYDTGNFIERFFFSCIPFYENEKLLDMLLLGYSYKETVVDLVIASDDQTISNNLIAKLGDNTDEFNKFIEAASNNLNIIIRNKVIDASLNFKDGKQDYADVLDIVSMLQTATEKATLPDSRLKAQEEKKDIVTEREQHEAYVLQANASSEEPTYIQ